MWRYLNVYMESTLESMQPNLDQLSEEEAQAYCAASSLEFANEARAAVMANCEKLLVMKAADV